jgi:hypothetical protein
VTDEKARAVEVLVGAGAAGGGAGLGGGGGGGGGGAATTAAVGGVGAEVAPSTLASVTVATSAYPTSAAVGTYVLASASGIGAGSQPSA